MDQVRVGEQVAEEPRARPGPGPAVGLGNDVQALNLQQVSRPGTPYVNRPGQGVGHLGVQALQVGQGHAGPYLSIRGVAGLQRHLLARVHLQNRGDIRVLPVVALLGLLLEPLAAIYFDAFHGGRSYQLPAVGH